MRVLCAAAWFGVQAMQQQVYSSGGGCNQSRDTYSVTEHVQGVGPISPTACSNPQRCPDNAPVSPVALLLHECSFANVKVSSYRKGPDNFDEWCNRHKLPPEAVELLKGMLALDPKKRISATDAALVSKSCLLLQLVLYVFGLAGRCAVVAGTGPKEAQQR
jgi:hypothetical protein